MSLITVSSLLLAWLMSWLCRLQIEDLATEAVCDHRVIDVIDYSRVADANVWGWWKITEWLSTGTGWNRGSCDGWRILMRPNCLQYMGTQPGTNKGCWRLDKCSASQDAVLTSCKVVKHSFAFWGQSSPLGRETEVQEQNQISVIRLLLSGEKWQAAVLQTNIDNTNINKTHWTELHWKLHRLSRFI